jgi:aspartyl-tRNA(Asn)/glutamyl-tRNA(Gln) amidotransferase subunit B
MSEYKTTIGLEIHAELRTKTKMFCNSANDSNEKRPNVNICPVCMAHPGTLPVINKEAVKHVLKVGVACGSTLADFTEFDRKNYFYPDIPKGYQISQYKYPLVTGGSINGIALTRIHLEEDTARSIHDEKLAGKEYSLVDFNRAGVPLMELVTEPVITSSEQVGAFARELQLILRYLGASEASMEKGQMRVEVNISVSKTSEFGTKVEVKNINSFKAAERAAEYEIKRQIDLIENGGSVVQETRGWDENKQVTFSQRKKEGSADYRYFPDPDLPKIKLSEIEEFSIENLKKEIPELPKDKRTRYKEEFGIKEEDIESFVTDLQLATFFEKVIDSIGSDKKDLVKLASNYITSDLAGLAKGDSGQEVSIGDVISKSHITSSEFAELIKMISSNSVSSRGAKDIIKIMFETGGDPNQIAKEKDLIQKNDIEALKVIVAEVVRVNEAVVLEYKAGKEKSIQFLVGQAMRESKGSANPGVLLEILKEVLK